VPLFEAKSGTVACAGVGGGLNIEVLAPDGTIFNDGAVNVLDGGAGRDLFFAGLIDKILGRRANETVLFV
jgi:hypothetical protein